jgi:hypothetical protein
MIKKEELNNQNISCCRKNLEVTVLEQNINCPNCGGTGILVKSFTVKHMVLDEVTEQVEYTDYYLCKNETCDTVYYNPNEKKTFIKAEIKVPIWFKKNANPKYACYCSKVTEEQVIDAVVNHGAKNVKEVNAITGAMKNSNCKENNPLGTCCHGIIQNAIDKGLSQLEYNKSMEE